jgi:hypothetical protein
VDYRGFGESGGAKANGPSAARQKWPADVDEAFAYLTKQKRVDQSRIAVGGAGINLDHRFWILRRRYRFFDPFRRARVLFAPGAKHGVPVFAKNPELEPMIVAWLKAHLPATGGTH